MAKSNWDKWKDSKKREAQRELKKAIKKTNTAYIIIAVIAVIAGFAASWAGLNVLCADDCFEIKGEQIITVTLDKTNADGKGFVYEDEGINYVSMGKDRSKNYTIETSLESKDGKLVCNISVVGEYPITYKVSGGRCDGQTLYRVIRVVDPDSEVGGDGK